MKSKLRAWLIEIVREAIRSERAQASPTYSLVTEPITIPDPATSSRVAIQIEPSFEQMQTEALAAQEKFYAPESK